MGDQVVGSTGLHASAGLVTVRGEHDGLRSVLQEADRHMYVHKRAARLDPEPVNATDIDVARVPEQLAERARFDAGER